MSSGKGWARSVLGVKTGAPSGVVCVMWISGEEVERYFSRSVEIALRVEETFSVLRWPDMYLGSMCEQGNVRGNERVREKDVLILCVDDD